MTTRVRTILLSIVWALAAASPALPFCLIRGSLGPQGGEDCCTQDPSQWRPENLPVPLWINEETDPSLWDGIRASYDAWQDVPSAYVTIEDVGFTPINVPNTNDGVNVVSFSNDEEQFPPGSNVLAFTAGNWGTNSGDDETITAFDVIFNDVGFDWGWPPAGGELSVKGVTMHELGHGLGLAHCWQGGPPGCGPDCQGSTMFGYVSGNGVSDESLELDDMAVLALAYPMWLVSAMVREESSGDPIADVLVTAGTTIPRDTVVYGRLPSPLPGNGTSCAGYVGGAVRTGPDGSLAFPVMDSVATLVFFKSGYDPDSVQISLSGIDTAEVLISLSETEFSSIQGTLKDTNTGDGIGGAVVLMQNGEPYDTSLTDEGTGEFSFTGVPVSLPGFVEYTGLEIYPVLPYPTFTRIESAIEVEAGTPTTIDFTLLPAGVFLVDDDGGDTYEEYFTPAIEEAGRTWAAYDVAAEGSSPVYSLDLFPAPPTIVWFTGNEAQNTVTLEELDSLLSFLDAGGKILLTGQNIAEDLWARDSTRTRDDLHVVYHGNVANNVSFGRGEKGVPIGEDFEKVLFVGSGGANNQTSKDLISAEGAGFSIIYYTQSPLDTVSLGTAAIAEEDIGDGKGGLVLLGFGLEALNRPNETDTTFVTRELAMRTILDWLSGETGIEGDREQGGPAPRAFFLAQNYPNPFNPQTSIVFSVPGGNGEAIRVSLRVYDVRGRLVAELVDGNLPAGTHEVVWEGRDLNGTLLASGTYFSRLTCGGETSVRKMLMLK